MSKLELEYRVGLLTPLHIGSGQGIAGIVDATLVRDAADLPQIPGSSIKGKLRDACSSLARWQRLKPKACSSERPCPSTDPCPICAMYGSTQRAGALWFGNAHLIAELKDYIATHDQDRRKRPFYESQVRSNVQISRWRGIAQQQLLFTTEIASPELVFTGKITGWIDTHGRTLTLNGAQQPADLGLLVAGLGLITHLGGRKSRGLGCCRFDISNISVDGQPLLRDDVLESWLNTLPNRGA